MCSSTVLERKEKKRNYRLHYLTIARSPQRRDQGLVNPAKGNTEFKYFISPLGIHNLEPCHNYEHLLQNKALFLLKNSVF